MNTAEKENRNNGGSPDVSVWAAALRMRFCEKALKQMQKFMSNVIGTEWEMPVVFAGMYAHLEYSSKLPSADAMLSGLGLASE